MIKTKRYYFYADEDAMERIKGAMPNLNISEAIRVALSQYDTIGKVEDDTEGVPLLCRKCGYSWTYKGNAYRIKCHKCGFHMRTGIMPGLSARSGEAAEGMSP